MASGKISTRQKMINMMYLVLTAMLAMNVSAEILNAFKTVNKSLDKTNQIFSQKNRHIYDRKKCLTKLKNIRLKLKRTLA